MEESHRRVFLAQDSTNSFEGFLKLPVEIRLRIWWYAAAQKPRVIQVYFHTRALKWSARDFTGGLPALIHVNQEARTEVLRSLSRAFDAYMDLERDTIYANDPAIGLREPMLQFTSSEPMSEIRHLALNLFSYSAWSEDSNLTPQTSPSPAEVMRTKLKNLKSFSLVLSEDGGSQYDLLEGIEYDGDGTYYEEERVGLTPLGSDYEDESEESEGDEIDWADPSLFAEAPTDLQPGAGAAHQASPIAHHGTTNPSTGPDLDEHDAETHFDALEHDAEAPADLQPGEDVAHQSSPIAHQVPASPPNGAALYLHDQLDDMAKFFHPFSRNVHFVDASSRAPFVEECWYWASEVRYGFRIEKDTNSEWVRPTISVMLLEGGLNPNDCTTVTSVLGFPSAIHFHGDHKELFGLADEDEDSDEDDQFNPFADDEIIASLFDDEEFAMNGGYDNDPYGLL
ncbi:hypothetical protein PVAG01_06285 [Phlyctema vagabunda]|uniref:2EXR domain-containing protein n=1 Tax=Phlyctema vagabunda TaxID=108571 RepID=A0ABR4PFS1_9HELO